MKEYAEGGKPDLTSEAWINRTGGLSGIEGNQDSTSSRRGEATEPRRALEPRLENKSLGNGQGWTPAALTKCGPRFDASPIGRGPALEAPEVVGTSPGGEAAVCARNTDCNLAGSSAQNAWAG